MIRNRRHPLAQIAAVLTLVTVIASSCSSGGRRGPPTAGFRGTTSTAPPSPATSPLQTPSTTNAPSGKGGTVVARLLAAVVPAARYRTMGAAVGRSMYLLGGLDSSGSSSSDVYRIDPATGQVTLAGHLSLPTHGAAAVNLGDQVLIFGGANVSPDDLVQDFDPATGTSAVIGHMPSARADLVAAEVGSQVVILAGFTGSAFVRDIWATTDGRSFSTVGQVAQLERYPAVAVMGTTVYLFGGLVGGGEYDGTYSNTIQSFDLGTRRSALVGQLPTPLAHARAAVVARQILIFGGWTPGGASSTILRFDPATGAVTPAGALPEPVADEAIATVGDTLYFAAGLGTGQHPLVEIGSVSVTAST